MIDQAGLGPEVVHPGVVHRWRGLSCGASPSPSRVLRMSVHRRTTRTTRRPAGWALLTGAALVLTGCTDDPAPTPIPSDAATSTETAPATPDPTEDPAPQPPERPAAMDGTDEEAAKAAAGYFLELYTYTLQSGDAMLWQSISDPECSTCSTVSEDVATTSAEGDRIEGGAITWKGAPVVTSIGDSGLREVRGTAVQSERTYVSDGGRTSETFALEELDLSVFVLDTGQWTLFEMSVAE
jgi:hypothetical protein